MSSKWNARLPTRPNFWKPNIHSFIHLFIHSSSTLSYYRSVAPSKAGSPQSAIYCFPFIFRYPAFSLRLSCSCLRLLPHLSITSNLPSIIRSITYFRRQFLRNMWTIQLACNEIIHNKIEGGVGVIHGVLYRNYQGVLYFQNVTRVYYIRVNINYTSKYTTPFPGWFSPLTYVKQHYMQITPKEFHPRRTTGM
jgi:hypothetical protein